MKHNKKRNTAFLYEALIREISKSMVENNINKAKNIKNIIFEYFNPSSELYKEIQLYNSLNKENIIEKNLADKYLQEIKNRYDKLDKKNLFNQQTKLINCINKEIGSYIYENFIPSYKDLASIYQIFNSDNITVKEKILLENKILDKITINDQENKNNLMDQVDKIVFREFNKKFNEKYSNSLLKEQKELLKNYIFSHEDGGLQFKIFLNEELERLKKEVESSINKEEIKNEEDLVRNAEKTIIFLKSIKDVKELSNDMLQKVLKIQQYVHEVNN